MLFLHRPLGRGQGFRKEGVVGEGGPGWREGTVLSGAASPRSQSSRDMETTDVPKERDHELSEPGCFMYGREDLG